MFRELGGEWERILAAIPLPLVLLDERGGIVNCNDSFRRHFGRLTGFPPESLEPGFFDFLEENEAFHLSIAYKSFTANAQPDSSANLESPARAIDGRVIWFKFHLRLAPPDMFGGRVTVCTIEDISPQKSREGRLLSEREEAERANSTKDQFIANMSHEIRTPIQTIIGATELLSDTALDGAQREYLRQIGFSSDVLLSLVNDILDLSRVEAGMIDLEDIDFDVRSCLEQAVRLIAMEAHRKGLEVILDVSRDLPPLLRGDPTRLRQVAVNLIKNAVKFTRSGEVFVSARRGKLDDGSESLKVEVADTGIGMSDEVREKLFTAFFQADSSHTRTYGGSGLGLSISRRIVELMGGRISARANDPDGSVFCFELPLVASSVADAPETRTLPGSLLIVDDHLTARLVESRIASSFGLKTESVASGQEALEILRAAAKSGEPFSACAIDQNMPMMDGWRLAAEISSDPLIAGTSLLLLSPEGTIGADAKMKLLNWFKGYVSKPVTPREFHRVLTHALGMDKEEEASLQEILPFAQVDAGACSGAGAGSGMSAGAGTSGMTELSLISREGAEDVSPTPKAPATILVVEDQQVNAELVKLILERFGCTVYVAADGQEALELYKERPFDLVFMDLQMPRLNGYAATRALRESGSLVPIIAMTAAVTKEEREECVQSGMNDILAKPFKREEIRTMLQYWMAHGDKLLSTRGMQGDNADGEGEGAGMQARGPQRVSKGDAAIFDFESVVDTFLGQRDVVVRLLGTFIDRTKKAIREIDAHMAEGALDAVATEAHGIKGSSWNLSARRLGNAAQALEHAARAGEREQAEDELALIREEFFAFAEEAQYFITASY